MSTSIWRSNLSIRMAGLLLAGMLAVTAGCGVMKPRADLPTELMPPPAPREFRAAWVATVANIDWPSKPGLSTEQQQAEIVEILDRAAELKLNAIVLQVRTSCDAFYPSKLEPWSEYLTGKQGQAPDPYYDPLKMWVDESHKRGIELHAWFNPYRARHSGAKSDVSADHIAKKNPKVVKSYGGYLWLDPGEPDAAKQSLAVFLDVLKRYDVDGIHIDDYFYPYPVQAPAPATAEGTTRPTTRPEVEFPDDPSWERYQAAGGKLARADWRRDNINRFIERLYRSIKSTKKTVPFGVSPFGIAKPSQRPAGIEGFSQYDKLYADAELWYESGWLDYFTPQLYWPIDQKKQAFPVLMTYWRDINKSKRHLWPGLFTSKVERTDRGWKPSEVANQIKVTRELTPADPGHVHFSMKALMDNRQGMNDQLTSELYQSDALVPATTWLDNKAPPAPTGTLREVSSGVSQLDLKPGGWFFAEKPRLWAVWSKHGSDWRFQVAPASKRSIQIVGTPEAVVVTAVDRSGNESDRVLLLPK